LTPKAENKEDKGIAMNKHISATCLLLITVCASIAANAARPSITNLQQQINQLNARINELENMEKPAIVVDGEGTILGVAIGDSQYGRGYTEIVVLNDKGYQYTVTRKEGDIREDSNTLEYTLPNCSGQAYSSTYSSSQIFKLSNPLGLWFTYPDAVHVEREIKSNNHALSPSICNTPTSYLQDVIEIYPNDPSITGVYQAELPAPISVIRQ